MISSPDDRVYVTEGEKDTKSVRGLGLTATTSGGASDPWLSEFNKYFTGREVVILADADGPGWAHGDKIAAELLPVAKSVQVVPSAGMGLPDQSDITNWTEAGHSNEELETLANNTPVVEKDEGSSAYTVQSNDSPQAKPITLSLADMPADVLDGRLGDI